MSPSDEATPIPGSPAWWLARRHPRERRPRRDGLTLDAIVEAALAVVQAGGAGSLTMRRVADELRTGPASLYRHVAGRDELVALVVDHVLATVEPAPTRPAGWRAVLEDGTRRFRAHLHAHIEVVPLIRSAQMLGPSSMAAREAALRTLTGLGLTPPDAVAAYLAIVHLTVANVQLDARTGAHDDDGRAQLEHLFAGQEDARFPSVVAHAPALAAHTSDAEFDFALAAILDRIETLVE